MPIGSPTTPYSAPRPRSLPTLTDQDPATMFANWQTQLANNVRNATPQATPQNFTVTNSIGAITLNWGIVPNSTNADGYEILKSPSGSFTTDLQIIPVKNVNQTSYVDTSVAGGTKCFYRIRTTSGTIQNPQSQRGPESGVLWHTSLISNSTSPVTTKQDSYTSDATRSLARNGNYGAFKLASQGRSARGQGAAGSGIPSGAGGSSTGSSSAGTGAVGGTSSGTASGSGGGTPPATSVPFSSITSGSNRSATMTVGAGAEIVPDVANPGVIEATEAPWATLFGDLTSTQFIYFDNTSTVGTPASSISQVSNGVIGIGSTTATNGALILATATVSSSLHVGNLSVTSTVYDSLQSAGTSGQVYTITATGLPQWKSPSSSSLLSVLTTSSSYKLLSTDQLVLFDAIVAVTATLNSLLSTGTNYIIKNTSTASNVFVVTTSGLIDYQTNIELTGLDSIDVDFDGTNWWIT